MVKQVLYQEIKVGDKIMMKKFVSSKDVKSFAKILGDEDSFHVSDEAANKSPFRGKICHGMHIASYISELIGKKLPGFGTIYCNQTLNFKNPLYINSDIIIEVKVLEKLKNKKLRLLTRVLDEQGLIILDGEAVVKASK